MLLRSVPSWCLVTGIFSISTLLSAPAAGASEAHAGAGSAPVAAPRETYDGPPTVLGRGRKVKVGGYGGFGAAYTRFMGRDSGLMSAEGALLLDHRLSLGAAAYGFTRTPAGPDASDGSPREFGAGYGGFVARYALFGHLPVYGSLGLVVGGGAVNLHDEHDWEDDDDWDDWEHEHHDSIGRLDPFFLVQPELTLHANLTRWLRVGAMVGYRFTAGVGRFGLQESDLNGLVTGANLQLGWF